MLKGPDILKLAKNGNPAPDCRVEKTDAEWRKQLRPEEYHVTREAGTERALSSQMCSLFEPGIYCCLCCGAVLFDASDKFESGTGWPSFTQPVKANVIVYRFDGPSFLKRVETICNTCDALWFANNPSRPKVPPFSAMVGTLVIREICWLGPSNPVRPKDRQKVVDSQAAIPSS